MVVSLTLPTAKEKAYKKTTSYAGYYATYVEIWPPYWSCEFEPMPLVDVLFWCAKTPGKNIVAAKQKVTYWASLIKIFIGNMPCAMPVNSTATAVQNSVENPVKCVARVNSVRSVLGFDHAFQGLLCLWFFLERFSSDNWCKVFMQLCTLSISLYTRH